MAGLNITHRAGCAVLADRESLAAEMAADPGNEYLQGAWVEYWNGGDQEVELCNCGAVPVCAVCDRVAMFAVAAAGETFTMCASHARDAKRDVPDASIFVYTPTLDAVEDFYDVPIGTRPRALGGAHDSLAAGRRMSQPPPEYFRHEH